MTPIRETWIFVILISAIWLLVGWLCGWQMPN